MTLDALKRAAAAAHLHMMGATHEAGRTVVLLGPGRTDFWAHFTASPEYTDALPDPLDRWSKRVIGALARTFDGTAVFPSDGPPWPPFTAWALATGACHVSPVGLTIHPGTGLWLSFRGAVILSGEYALPAPRPAPCTTCADRPCLAACPAGAMGPDGYDVAGCHAWLDQPAGAKCLMQGCLVRRACPPGQKYGRLAAQSAFHMKAFHPI